MTIENLTRKTRISAAPVRACGFSTRLRGMIGRGFDGFDAMVFDRCSAVHTCFMRIPLDLLFVGGENRVLKAVENVKPWTFSVSARGARCVIELPAGTIRNSMTEAGDALDLDVISIESLEKRKKQAIFSARPEHIATFGKSKS